MTMHEMARADRNSIAPYPLIAGSLDRGLDFSALI